MLLRPSHPQHQGTLPLHLVASFVLHAMVVLSLAWLLDIAPFDDGDTKSDAPMSVRVLSESELPSSMRNKLKKRLAKNRKKKPKPKVEKEKKKFVDPKHLRHDNSPTQQKEETPDDAVFAGRYATKTARDQIKKGTEGDPRGNRSVDSAQRNKERSRLATDVKKRFDKSKKKQSGELNDRPSAEGKTIKSKDFASEPDIVLPNARKSANSPDLKVSNKRQSGTSQGDINSKSKQLFPSLANTRQLAKKYGNNGTFNSLKNIPDANRTLLNRKKSRYWTFFDRLTRQLKRQWNPVKVYNKRDPYRNIYGTKDRYTVLDVTLKGNGKVHKLHIAKSSGLDFYDDEAIRAMLAAAPFPNPPEGLKDEDGFIHFKFGFILTIETGSSRFFRLR